MIMVKGENAQNAMGGKDDEAGGATMSLMNRIKKRHATYCLWI